MGLYRLKKAPNISAFKWDGEPGTAAEIRAAFGADYVVVNNTVNGIRLALKTLHGIIHVVEGEYAVMEPMPGNPRFFARDAGWFERYYEESTADDE